MSISEPSLGSVLARLRHLQHRYMQPHFSRLGIFRGQPRVLFALDDSPGLSQAELTGRVHVQAPTAARMILRMEEAGLVRREHDPVDHRVNRLYLTDAGRDVLRAFREVTAREAVEVFTALTEEEQDQMRALLVRLCDRYEALVEELP